MKDDLEFGRWLSDIVPEIDRSASAIVASGAQDIVQDVCVMAVLRRTEFKTFEEFRRWCYKRAHWLALDELVRQSWFARESEKEIGRLAAAENDPDRLALHRAIEQLPPKQQTVVRERIEGYLTVEIAERNGIKKSTVRSLWRHAKQNLVIQFEGERDET